MLTHWSYIFLTLTHWFVNHTKNANVLLTLPTVEYLNVIIISNSMIQNKGVLWDQHVCSHAARSMRLSPYDNRTTHGGWKQSSSAKNVIIQHKQHRLNREAPNNIFCSIKLFIYPSVHHYHNIYYLEISDHYELNMIIMWGMQEKWMHYHLLDDFTTWKCFLPCWPFVKGIHRFLIDSSQRAGNVERQCFCRWLKRLRLEQTVKLLLIWDAVILMGRHSNGDTFLCHLDIHPSLSIWWCLWINQVRLLFIMRLTWQSCQLCHVLEGRHQNLYKHNIMNLIIDEISFYLIKTIPW